MYLLFWPELRDAVGVVVVWSHIRLPVLIGIPTMHCAKLLMQTSKWLPWCQKLDIRVYLLLGRRQRPQSLKGVRRVVMFTFLDQRRTRNSSSPRLVRAKFKCILIVTTGPTSLWHLGAFSKKQKQQQSNWEENEISCPFPQPPSHMAPPMIRRHQCLTFRISCASY